MTQAIIPFAFDDALIRVQQDENGAPWFVAKDVCAVLEHSNYRMAAQMLDEDEKGVRKVYTLGGEQEMLLVNESGLYTLIIRSNKPEAKRFRKWVTAEVLPTIRKTGSYSAFAGKELTEAMKGLPHALKQSIGHELALAARERPENLPHVEAALYRFCLAAAPQQAIGEEPPLLREFWECVAQLEIAGHKVNHSRSHCLIALNLPEITALAKAEGYYSFEAGELRPLFPLGTTPKLLVSNKTLRSAIAKKNVKCWIFSKTAA